LDNEDNCHIPMIMVPWSLYHSSIYIYSSNHCLSLLNLWKVRVRLLHMTRCTTNKTDYQDIHFCSWNIFETGVVILSSQYFKIHVHWFLLSVKYAYRRTLLERNGTLCNIPSKTNLLKMSYCGLSKVYWAWYCPNTRH
jgi:hypothetical protein